jgi:hypothetical protein
MTTPEGTVISKESKNNRQTPGNPKAPSSLPTGD